MPVKLRFTPISPVSRSGAPPTTAPPESTSAASASPDADHDSLELIADYRLPLRVRSAPSADGPDNLRAPVRTADPDAVTLDLEDDDLLEIELDDELTLWTTAADFRDDAAALGIEANGPPDAALSGAANPALDLDAPFAALDTTPTRGLRRSLARGLRVFRRRHRPVVDNLVELVTALEARRDLGLYPCAGGQGLRTLDARERITRPLRKTAAPMLLLIHGTASSYEGSFGDLVGDHPHNGDPANPGTGELLTRYAPRIYAFEHATLARSPIDNAIELLELLPKGQELALLTHSRGGLIGDLLCLPPTLDMQRLKAYRRDDVWLAETGLPATAALKRTLTEADTKDRERLVQLAALIKEKQPKVTAFVRVACPAQGTTLASRRLDRFLSIVANLVGFLPPLRTSPLYLWLRGLTREVVARRVRPDQLPGLEAMLPYSPLVAFLNAEGVEAPGELGVIAGDIEGGRLLQRLSLLILDRLYRGEHDLVVDTASMSGGLSRRGGTYRCFDQGERVSHFRYFGNARTREALLAWLTRKAGEPVPGAFTRVDERADALADEPPLTGRLPAAATADAGTAARATPPTRGERTRPHRPILFLLPGIMGSHLKVRRSRIWLTPGRILRGRLKDLAIDSRDVAPDGAFRRYYGELVQHLARTHDVHVFDYDWRLPLEDSARRLAADVAAALEATRKAGAANTPIRFLAHSMGGLVLRTLLGAHEDLRRDLEAREGLRMVMLGTPNRGSHAIVEAMLGHAQAVKQLAAINAGRSLNTLLRQLCAYPGVLDLLPEDEDHDLWQHAAWKHLVAHNRGFGTPPAAQTLAAAARRRERLEAALPDPERTVIVAGVAATTPNGIEITTRGQLGERVHFRATGEGDGRVTWAAAALPETPMRWAEVGHGDLPRARAHFEAYAQLLDGVASPRGLAEHAVHPVRRSTAFTYLPRAALYPDTTTLIDSLMGGQGEGVVRSAGPGRTRLRIRVHAEDLAAACCPVVVAHAAGSAIAGAEAALDAHLNGALSARLRLGRYPGRLGEVATIWPIDTAGLPSGREGLGGIVVGLGRLGEISRATLQEAARIAALEYVLTLPAEQHPRAGLRMATVLFGVNSPESLHPGAVMEAIVRGVIEANRELREQARAALQLDELAFFEHDAARLIEAHAMFATMQAQLAAELEADLDLGPAPQAPTPAPSTAALSRRSPPRWHQLSVTTVAGNPNRLRYELLTRRARLEVREHPIDAPMILSLVAEAISDAHANPMLANTLHHLLIPKRLEEALEHLGPVQLLLDEDTAWIPFELLHSNRAPTRAPHAVRHGMIRQFRTHVFDESPTMASGRNALVIGDPPSDYPPLPGAAEEARRVRSMLMQHGFEVAGNSEHSSAADILNLLYDRPWRILHVAAHGVYREHGEGGAEAGESGIVIGPGQLLTGVHIRAMREVPEFVFLNCCHLGKMGERAAEERRGMPMFAGNVARQFIKAGVKGVVVAGWEIPDDVAVVFAEGVYRGLMGGEGVGESVRGVTGEVWRASPRDFGWAAWQFYGDAAPKGL